MNDFVEDEHSGKIKGMTMPVDDDTPRLAEISRSISDFRAEFRSAVDSMVRRDVYGADMRTMDVRISAIQTDVARATADLEKDVLRVSKEMAEDKQARATLRNLMLSSLFATAGTLVVSIVLAVVK